MPLSSLVDSHAHLTMPPFGASPGMDLPGVLARAREAGVSHVLTVGTTATETREAIALAGRFPDLVSAAGGVHPHESSRWEAQEKEFAGFAGEGLLRALGETGLDFHYHHSPPEDQERAFCAHLDLARSVRLPVIIHLRNDLSAPRERGAYSRALALLAGKGPLPAGGVVHCFSGTLAEGRAFLALGLDLSLSGTITFPSGRSREWNREVLAHLPLDRLLVETDCPFLAPHPHRGRTNEPALVGLVAAKLAEVKGVSPGDAARVTGRNAARLFSLPLPLPSSVVAYTIRDSVYVNVTSRCPNACSFCRRATDPVVKGHDLSLPRDPAPAEMLAALGEERWRERSEVVFCGYGEPTCRLGEVLEVARDLKGKGARRIRLNTNGLGSLMAGRDVVPDLRGLVDAVSISLNAQDEETYAAACRPGLPGAFGGVLAFARACAEAGMETTLTAVPWPGVDIEACRAIAEGLGARFRVRPLDEVG